MSASGPGVAQSGAVVSTRGGRLVRLAVLALLGVVAGLGQEPFGWWWATLAALAVAFRLVAPAPDSRTAMVNLWALGFGYFAFTMRWLIEPFLVEPEIYGWMAPFALVFMAAGLALFWGAAGVLAARLGRGPVALTVTLTLAETARSLVFTGLPWALAGHVWIDTPVAQLAALVGPHGLSLLTFALAAGLARAWPGPWIVVPPAVLTALWLALNPGPAAPLAPNAPVVRLVQPNIPQDEKWNPDLIPEQVNRVLRLTAGPVAADGTPAPVPDLVVWPETTMPWLLEDSADLIEVAIDAAKGAPIAMGVQRGEGGLYYNSLALVDGSGRIAATYDKHHLVPFGEYIPFGDLLGRWGIRGLAATDGAAYASGPGPAVMSVPGIGTVMPLICYEGIFAEEVNAMPDRADLLLLITNDAWFGTSVGPFQHLAQGRLRAIEQGLPMVRVANTGVSAVIDAQGRVVASIPLGVEGVLDLPLPPALAPTLYARAGDWPVILLLLFVAAALFLRRTRDSG
jgi:apolipoprotein N-acyltransferase